METVDYEWSKKWYESVNRIQQIKEVKMPRKGENIRKRKDGRWEARYMKGRDMDGKIRYGYLYGKSYKEVKDKKIKIISEYLSFLAYGNQPSVLLEDDRIRTVSVQWRNHIRYTIKVSTYSNYGEILDNHILPVLGDTPIRKFTNRILLNFVQRELEKGMSYGSIHVIMGVLKNLLHYGQELGCFPAELLKFPRIPAGGKEIRIMSKEDFRKLDAFLSEGLDPFTFGILLCMYTGIRVGELCGLKWEDLDFSHRKIYIRRTVTRVKNLDVTFSEGKGVSPRTRLNIGTPKTSTSIREIPLPDRLLSLGTALKKNGSCFLLTGTENCVEPRTVQRRYASLLKKCQIPHIKIHSLRHQFSCRWIEQGFDTKSLSEILGHTSVKTTLDLYVHIQAETKREYMNQLTTP